MKLFAVLQLEKFSNFDPPEGFKVSFGGYQYFLPVFATEEEARKEYPTAEFLEINVPDLKGEK